MADLTAYLEQLSGSLDDKVARGALKDGANVIAEGARDECKSSEVRASIKTSSKVEPGIVSAKVETKGKGAYLAPWLEYGTEEHFISVDETQSGGRTARRVNRLVKEGSLVINGKFVGKTVHHRGADPFPFMRPAADTREQAAIEAIGRGIRKRLPTIAGGTPIPEEPDE
ncbi:HK97 gp10 family phage protein [Sphingomonadaceae bacterium G21617-S1]|nr:HK97 gp10 family phage protein [Sphingomonadaceae bacterium G21617-S1]